MLNVHVCNVGISCIRGKELLRQLAFHQEYKDLTMKQMFDISAKLITEESDEIYGVKTIDWENSSWKYLSLIGDEEVISLFSAQKSTYFQILYCVLVRCTRTPNQTLHGNKD